MRKIIIKIILNIVNSFLYIRLKLLAKRYPDNPDKRVYIHLKCREVNSMEFINVDSRLFPHIHHLNDVTNLDYFKSDFADLIYASHILEHISVNKLENVLREWKRVLKKGGVLRLAFPISIQY